jgi:ribosomal-protein-serine acetyltransferase
MNISINQDLELKLLQSEDIQSLFDLVNKNRERLKKWFPWLDSVVGPEDIKKYIEENIESFANKKCFDLGIFYKGKMAGSVSVNRIDQFHKITDLGYWLDENYTGKGIVTNSVKALCDYLFKELDINRIEIKIIPENIKSRGIPERLGFAYEGVLRQAKYLNDKFFDYKIYSLLRSDKR